MKFVPGDIYFDDYFSVVHANICDESGRQITAKRLPCASKAERGPTIEAAQEWQKRELSFLKKNPDWYDS